MPKKSDMSGKLQQEIGVFFHVKEEQKKQTLTKNRRRVFKQPPEDMLERESRLISCHLDPKELSDIMRYTTIANQ